MGSRITLLIIIVLAVLAAFFVYPSLASKVGLQVFDAVPYKLGLDLKGGTHLVYQADVSQIPEGDKDEAMEGLKNVIEARVNQFGVSEPVIAVNNQSYRLIAELAGVLDVKEAIRIIGETPFLEFRELKGEETVDTATTTLELPENFEFISTELTGRYLQTATFSLDPNTGQPVVLLKFNSEGAELFRQITARNVGRPLAIYLDGASIIDTDGDGNITESDLYAPIVQQEITGGEAVITGTGVEEAQKLVQNLKAGALPLPITLISQQTIGPALGAESLQKSLFAGIIGFVAVVIYMIIYYRGAGVIAAVVLALYMLFTLAIFKLIGVTLTLAGIVGFILTIGMAVDANILIFERLKEELRRGREFRVAVEEGFRHAWTAIRDANVSTIMTAVVLYALTTSLIRGFAVTLAIGLVLSLIASMVLTRILLRLVAGTWLSERKSLWRA